MKLLKRKVKKHVRKPSIKNYEFIFLHKLKFNIINMKHLLLACLLLSTHVRGQDALPLDEQGNILFTGVIEIPELSKGELYANAKEWISSNYKSSKVIKNEDHLDGVINCKHMFQVFGVSKKGKKAGFVNYQLDLFIKEGKYRYKLHALKHVDHTDQVGSGGILENEEPFCGYKKLKKETWVGIKNQSLENVKEIINSLMKGMSYQEEDQEDNW